MRLLIWHIGFFAELVAGSDVGLHCAVKGRPIAHGQKKLQAALEAVGLQLGVTEMAEAHVVVQPAEFEVFASDPAEAASLATMAFCGLSCFSIVLEGLLVLLR